MASDNQIGPEVRAATIANPEARKLAPTQAIGKEGATVPEGFGQFGGMPLRNEEGRTPGMQRFYETWNPRGVREAMARENRVAVETPFGMSEWQQAWRS